MTITDAAKAEEYLARIGYYRLSAYWYGFRVIEAEGQVGDAFKPGTEFQSVVALYVFDKRLRLLMLDALERIEIALRTDVALQLGAKNPFTHRDPANFDSHFTQVSNGFSKSRHQNWLDRLDRMETKSKEEFAKHFRTKYAGSNFPIWITVEMLEFGSLSILLSGLPYADRRAIAGRYGVTDAQMFTSWIRTLTGVRNVCAHHARLWNKPLIDQPRLPAPTTLPVLDHLRADRYAQTRLYAAAAIAAYLLGTINPSSTWRDRFKALMADFPTNPHVTLRGAGLPLGWEQLPLWH